MIGLKKDPEKEKLMSKVWLISEHNWI